MGDCSFVVRRRGWMFWNRTMRARDMFGRLYAVIFVGLQSAMCQPGTSRCHTNWATHARSATTTMDSALHCSYRSSLVHYSATLIAMLLLNKLKFTDRAFSHAAPTIWNGLPTSVTPPVHWNIPNGRSKLNCTIVRLTVTDS